MLSDRYEIAQNYFLFGTSNGKIIDYFTQPTLKTVPKLEPHLEVCEISLTGNQNIKIYANLFETFSAVPTNSSKSKIVI